jgi:hypothetical protein
MSREEVLQKEFELLSIDLIKAYDAKGMRASGKWADSLEVESSPLSAVLRGLDYTQQLESGRRANNGSSGESWETTLEDIEQWIRDKGITPRENTMKLSTLAYLIARKIWREGWGREGFGGVELISEVVTDERIQSIIDKVGDVSAVEISTDIIKLIKEI